MANAAAESGNPSPLPPLAPVRTVDTRTLTVGYVEAGPPDGEMVLSSTGNWCRRVQSKTCLLPMVVVTVHPKRWWRSAVWTRR